MGLLGNKMCLLEDSVGLLGDKMGLLTDSLGLLKCGVRDKEREGIERGS